MTRAGRGSPRPGASNVGAVPSAGPSGTSILFVCTANQCRSPLAEAIARHHAAGRPIVVASAGLIDDGRPTPERGLAAAAERGLDLTGHLSRRADVTNLRGWDVILTMSREHIRELVAADAGLWPRVFTVKQFRRWIEHSELPRGVALGTWLDVAAAGRSRFEAIGADPADDIEDPLHASMGVWRAVADTLDHEITAILDALDAPRDE
jgi:protein-tyrosine phosphatase